MAGHDSSDRYALIPIPNAPVHVSGDGSMAEWMPIDMALAHNVIIRGVNSLWRNALRVAPHDVVAFSGYAISCLQFIHGHHRGEEEVLFPRLQTKIDMDVNVQQHDAFRTPMGEFEECMTRVNAGLEEYDGERTREAIKAFGDPLVDHLKEEIATIMPEKLAVFSNEELVAFEEALGEHHKAQGHVFTLFSFMLTAHDKRDTPNWPPIPAPIKWVASNVLYFANRSYWKFSPFTRSGEPQTYSE